LIAHTGWCDGWNSTGDGYTDEGLRKDFSWAFTPAIVEWKHGDFADELVEVSHEQAQMIIGYFPGAVGAVRAAGGVVR
jgi:hypothetical protein